MIKGITYSKRVAVTCTMVLGAAMLISWLSQKFAAAQDQRLRSTLNLEEQLSRQVAALSEFGDRNLAGLRSYVSHFQLLLGSKDQKETVVRTFGASWARDSGSVEEKEGYSLSTDIYRKVSPALSDWQRTVDILRSLEEVPGVSVTGFEMSTSGDRNQRSVDVLRVKVETRTRRSMQG
jgi:hypothetical protein